MGEFAAKFRPDIDLDEFERRLRAAAPGPQPRSQQSEAPDPLAELARLVGGEDRGRDPFEALFRAQAAISEIRHEPQVETPDLHAPHEPYFEDEGGHFDPHAQAEASHFTADPLPYGETDPDWNAGVAHEQAAAGWSGDDHARAEPVVAARRGKVFAVMSAVIAIGVASIGATLALRGHGGPHEVVTIPADSEPARVKPEQADNSTDAGSQALFNRTDNAASAKVVGSAEQPADLGAAVKNVRPAVPDAPAPVAAAPASDAPFPQPKKVRTVSVRADGSLVGNDAKPQAPHMGLPSMAGLPAPILATSNPKTAKAAETKSADRASATTGAQGVQAALKPPAKPKPAKPAEAEPEIAGATGVWFVQLASSPAEADARSKANTLSARFSGPLKGRHATFVEGKKGDATVYRVRVGHLTEESAKQMCSAVKGQGGDCYVAKN